MSKLRWPLVGAWALYDFSATAFSMGVISTYFSLWVVQDHGGTDLDYGLAKSLSMVAVALASPLLGGLSDRAGRRRPYLIACAAIYVLGAMGLGLATSLWAGLAIFVIANFGMQVSGVFYNAMLQAIAPRERMGQISGLGKTVSYLGAIAAVLVGRHFASPTSTQGVFVPLALVSLVAALPLCLMREPEIAPNPTATHPSWRRLIGDLRAVNALPGVGRFLIASFFYFDTVNTIRDFMSIYMVRVVGLSKGASLEPFLLVLVVCSLVGAFLWGLITDRVGPKSALIGVLSLLAVGFLGLILFPTPALVLHVLGPLLGLAFGGVLVTTRPLLASIVPVARQGEFFGLFVLSNDCAAILGPVIWGVVVARLHAYGALAYQTAVGIQLCFLLLGLGLIFGMRVPQRAEPAGIEPSPYDPELRGEA